MQQRLWHNRYFIPMDTKRIQKLELWLDELYRAKESIRASKGEFINDQIITQLKKLKIDNFLPWSRLIYVNFSNQAVFAFADESHTKQWFDTISFLK